MTNVIKTGRTFETKIVDLGHRNGKLCLTCGIFVDRLCCEDCKLLSKCTLCGIICKVNPTNKLYSYVRTADKKISEEVYVEVDTICKKLEGGLCEHCVSWEDRIKDLCFLCSTVFNNGFKPFKEKGNCCKTCYNQVLANLKQKLSTPKL